MSLRKSPTLTPALLASNRRNAKKSTGPRTARGKAISRLNRFRHGNRSPEYVNFLKAVLDAPLGEMGRTVQTRLLSKQVIHPLFTHIADAFVEADIGICKERGRVRTESEKTVHTRTFEAGTLLKTKVNGNDTSR